MSAIPETLIDLARRTPRLRLLVLHGSRARGTQHGRSDWDFAYLGEDSFDADGLLADFVEALGSEAVDLADLDRAGALLRYRVARDGVLVFEAAPGLFERFRLDAIHTWCDMEPVLTPLYDRVLAELEQQR